jgi:hypothetical protein
VALTSMKFVPSSILWKLFCAACTAALEMREFAFLRCAICSRRARKVDLAGRFQRRRATGVQVSDQVGDLRKKLDCKALRNARCGLCNVGWGEDRRGRQNPGRSQNAGRFGFCR